MTRYRMPDGFEFEAPDAFQAIAKLRAASHEPRASFGEYMADIARRAGIYTGRDFTPDDAERLVPELIKAGLLTPLP